MVGEDSIEKIEEKISSYLERGWNYEEIPVGPVEIDSLRIISPRGRVYNAMEVIYPKFADCYLCSQYLRDNPFEDKVACMHPDADLREVEEARTLAELLGE